MTEPDDSSVHPRLRRMLDASEAFCASVLALSLPWEVYQRIPFTGLTVVKLAGFALITSVFCRFVLERRFPIPRAGLAIPIAILVAAAVISTVASSHRAASIEFVGLCITHLLLFFAMAASTQTAARAKRLVMLYVASCSGVGVLAFACKASLLLPTYWRPSVYPWTQRLIIEASSGTPMRLVAASSDLNQGALHLLLGFAASLFIFDARTMRVVPRVALFGAQIAMIGGCMIAQSRSALMAAALIAAFSVAWRQRISSPRRSSFIVSGCIALALVSAVWIGLTYFAVRDEDSVASRMVAYRAAIELLPRYMWLGTGLNVSDEVIALTEWGARVDGATVHSVPLKVLLESGVLGFGGYACLWVSLTFAFLRRTRYDSDTDALRLGATGLALGCAIFTMSLVQPFMTFPSFPFFFGLVLGPSAFHWGASARMQRNPTLSIVVPMILVGALAVTNITLYQLGSHRVEHFAQKLEAGAAAEKEGRYESALDAYRGALALASPDTAANRFLVGVPLANLPGFDALSKVLDLPRAYYQMNVYCTEPSPQSACLYAAGRCLIAIGDRQSAGQSLKAAIEVEPSLAEVEFALAEFNWTRGHFRDAIAGYEKARSDEALWHNRRYRETSTRYEQRLADLLAASSLDARLERARILRLRGRWMEAVRLYKEAVTDNPACAEALFNLGADAEVRNDLDAAMEYYLRAYRASAEHLETLRRIETLSGQQGAL